MEKKELKIAQGLATVSRFGLEFNGRIYTNASMIRNQWFEMAAVQGSWQIPVVYYPEEPGEVMLFDIKTAEIATSVENAKSVCGELKELYFEALNSLKEQLLKSKDNATKGIW